MPMAVCEKIIKLLKRVTRPKLKKQFGTEKSVHATRTTDSTHM